MILYHGSDRTVTEPKLQTNAAKKELGPGFYLTPDSAQAAIAARTRVRREQRLLEDKSADEGASFRYSNWMRTFS